jgi:uncharacterized protein YycO
MHPGDLLLIRTDHFVSKLIRFGQRGYGKDAAQWNHVAICVGGGKIVEALTSGVVLSSASKYPAVDVLAVSTRSWQQEGKGVMFDFADAAMRANACSFARSCVGERYGWPTIAAIAVKVLTRGKVDFGVEGTSICSGLAARALERLGYDWNPWDPAELTPAYLAKTLG